MSNDQVNHKELPKTYSSQDIESKWYETWESGKYFKPRPGKTGKSYCIIMPPPNVTGRLHAGHALDITTQDSIIRFKRMKGFETLFLPGMDHAGIATQNVVEKMLYKQEGKSRHDFQREEFVQKIWKWKEEYGGIIAKQQRSMGGSPDWDYSMFTMDPAANEAVKKVFVDLYNEGLIYQADYIVNWDPVLQSAISDAEVEHQEVQGAFYHLKYPIKGSDELVEIATTRPETMLGDTALCVHPDDERFKHLIGKKAIVPLCNREVPIIADEYVDMEKGTGCLKVTPGHDFNDFEIGKRHNLTTLNILNKDGTLNQYGLEWQGLSCHKARPKIVEKLQALGVLVDVKKHVHQVGHGDRSKAIIEPMVSKQWFLNVQDMASEAVKAVETDKTRFFPKQWENTYFSWLREPKNWCISRQLWWGHQIPVFYCQACHHQWADASEVKTCSQCHSTQVTQDPDVLDTWFSSALWPFSTLGWPDPERMKDKKFDTFFPTSTLVTGFDIIFFWVARMMMMSLKFTKQIPFDRVYIHAIVRDKLGRKMSKSLNNGIDPLDMVDQYGADAFRFTLAAGSGYNRTLNLDPERINGYRNFINKLWNAFRFIHPFLDQAQNELPKTSELDHHERWVISELNHVIAKINESFDDFRFDDVCSHLYAFVYDKFCSWFIELSKPILYAQDIERRLRRSSVLRYCFREIMALLHPISPYITEELWCHLKNNNEDLLIIHDYPEFKGELEFSEDQAKMNLFIEVMTAIRNLRSSVQMKPKDEIEVALFTDDSNLKSYFLANKTYFNELTRTKKLQVFDKDQPRPQKCIMKVTPYAEVFIPLEGIVDIDAQVARLTKELAKVEDEYQKLSKKLKNPKFMDNAKEEVIFDVTTRAQEAENKVNSLKENLANFSE